MKKVIIIIMMVIMTITMAACGKSGAATRKEAVNSLIADLNLRDTSYNVAAIISRDGDVRTVDADSGEYAGFVSDIHKGITLKQLQVMLEQLKVPEDKVLTREELDNIIELWLAKTNLGYSAPIIESAEMQEVAANVQ